MMKIFILCLIVIQILVSKCLYDNEINLECNGKTFNNVTLTAYFPDYSDEDHLRRYLDFRGKLLQTLQDYMDNRADYVTLSMDEKLGIPYGSRVCIPELNKHFGHRIILEARDTSSDLSGSGYKRADICVRSEIDSYDLAVNGRVTLVFPQL